jgi:hypothetical protein
LFELSFYPFFIYFFKQKQKSIPKKAFCDFRVPIKPKKELEHKSITRGTADILYNKDQVLVGWKDNKAVYMASNVHGADMDKNCRRYSRVEKKEIQVCSDFIFA